MSNFEYEVKQMLAALEPVLAEQTPIERTQHEALSALWARLNIHRNNGDFSHRAECTKLLSRLDDAKTRLRQMWCSPSMPQLLKQVELLEAALAPLTARRIATWGECVESADAQAETLLKRALSTRMRQLEERASVLALSR